MSKIVVLLAICLTAAALPQLEDTRIAGGAQSTPGQHPFAAAIFLTQDSVSYQLVCGGTIINHRSVLSATSCWHNVYPSQLRIRVGSVNARSGGSVHIVATIISHPDFNEWNRNNNIGILRVVTFFPFGSNVQPAPIAVANYHVGDNVNVTTIDWGQTSVNGTNRNLLRWANIRTVNQQRCQNTYGLNFLMASMMCAGSLTPGEEQPRASCAGDIGSPLFHNIFVIGVTSFTVGCGDNSFPAIYTRVQRYHTWIQTNA